MKLSVLLIFRKLAEHFPLDSPGYYGQHEGVYESTTNFSLALFVLKINYSFHFDSANIAEYFPRFVERLSSAGTGSWLKDTP